MKILLIPYLLLISQVTHAEDTPPKLTSKESLARLNKTGVIDVVFWLKPVIMPPGNRTAFDPRIDPKWMVTIANHSKESIVINKHWFICNDWMDMTEAKSGKAVARFSSFPCKDEEPLFILPAGSKEIECGLDSFECLVSTSHDDRVVFSRPGAYRVTHDLFPSAELRFSISSTGSISIQMPPIYPNNTNKEAQQGGADQPATAPELKSKGKDKPQLESKVRPQ